MKREKIYADLHTHSTASDGMYSPAELINRAKDVNLSVVALTDHDTVYGLDEAGAEAKKLGIELISGIEISCGWAGSDISVHVLGLYIDKQAKMLQQLLLDQKQKRRVRAFKILDLLEKEGVEVDELRTRFENSPDKVLGRPHVARYLLEKGVVADFQQAFTRFLSRGKPAYVPKDNVLPELGIETIHASGGAAVLAHPGLIADWSSVWGKISGLSWNGIEAYYAEHTNKQVEQFVSLANERGFFCSGGSDFHGEYGKHKGRLGKYGLTKELYGAMSHKVNLLVRAAG